MTNPSPPLPDRLANDIGMEFVLIPAGSFEMGSNEGYKDEAPVHTVAISRPFYLSKTVVTQAQWKAAMGTEPWKGAQYVVEGANYPASCIGWDEARSFAETLSRRDGRRYRLPTEAEWEYAARAGEGDRYGSALGRVAWTWENTIDERYAHPVGLKEPNAWGLYDMLGNVWEWCEDWFAETYYSESPSTDPTGPKTGVVHVLRGGSFHVGRGAARLSYRYRHTPDPGKLGVRLVLLPAAEG